MIGRRKVQTLKHGLLATAIGVFLLASLLILPIQVMTLEATPQSKGPTYGWNMQGRHSTAPLSWEDAVVPSSSLSTRNLSTMSASSSSSDDYNDMEVSVEWINNYKWWQPLWWDLDHADESALGFYNELGDAGWTKSGSYGNDNAWEADFEKSSVGGWDSYYVDDVDFAYFAGHGGKGFLKFSTNHDGDSHHTVEVHYSENKWGDGDLEWMTLVSCKTLHPNYKDEWINNACEGKHLHALCGFKTSPLDDEAKVLGETFAEYLLAGKGIKDAWKTATKANCTNAEAAIIYARVFYRTSLLYNYAQETLPNEGNYIGTDPSYYAGQPDFSADYVYESWGC